MIKLNVRQILEQQGKTPYWLAKETGISNNNIANICNGDTKSIRLDTMEKICKALNCTPNDIIESDDPQLKRFMAYSSTLNSINKNTK